MDTRNRRSHVHGLADRCRILWSGGAVPSCWPQGTAGAADTCPSVLDVFVTSSNRARDQQAARPAVLLHPTRQGSGPSTRMVRWSKNGSGCIHRKLGGARGEWLRPYSLASSTLPPSGEASISRLLDPLLFHTHTCFLVSSHGSVHTMAVRWPAYELGGGTRKPCAHSKWRVAVLETKLGFSACGRSVATARHLTGRCWLPTAHPEGGRLKQLNVSTPRLGEHNPQRGKALEIKNSPRKSGPTAPPSGKRTFSTSSPASRGCTTAGKKWGGS